MITTGARARHNPQTAPSTIRLLQPCEGYPRSRTSVRRVKNRMPYATALFRAGTWRQSHCATGTEFVSMLAIKAEAAKFEAQEPPKATAIPLWLSSKAPRLCPFNVPEAAYTG